MGYEIPYVDYDYDIDYEQARMVGKVYIKSQEEFDKMLENVDVDITDEFMSHINDYINWDENPKVNVTKRAVKKALVELINHIDDIEYEDEDYFYGDIHRGFIAGEFGLTKKEIKEAEKRWFTCKNYGYYQEVCQEIIEERKG